MTALLLVAILVALLIGWLILRVLFSPGDSRLRCSSKEDRTALERQIAQLAARIFKLEQQLESSPHHFESVTPQTGPATVQAQVPQIGRAEAPQTFVQPLPRTPAVAASAAPQIQHDPAPLFSRNPSFAVPRPRPAWSDRLRQFIGDSEWETLVAGSVMNKIGALLVVIGIALFLGYSFQRVNPAGRAATAAFISAGILTGGVILGQRQQYRVFSRGLIGAGWAALYTTAYAMYALPAAQVISNPFAGSILLLAVSTGMVAHSLRYHAQAVTAVAYFTAFAALAVTPSTPFAVASLIPLAASLLYFAWRFEWYPMALFGLFATYATCISRGSSNAPLYATTSLFITYWLLFEALDVLRSRRRAQAAGLRWIFPLNAIAFLGLTYQAWSMHAEQEMWRIAAVSALLFLASAMLRILVRPENIENATSDPFDCIRRGTYEAPLIIAAVLAGVAILGRITGFWTNLALAFEAEIFYLAGARFQSRFLRGLGRSGFAASLGDVLATALRDLGTIPLLGVSLHNWTPSVIVHIFLFYLNRALWGAVTGFSFAATALVTLVVIFELTPHMAPLALFLLALVLLEIALRKKLVDLRIQSYLVAATATGLVIWAGGFAPYATVPVWRSSAAAAIACWLITARVFFISSNEPRAQEIARVRDLFAISGSGFALLTLWMLLPGPETAAVWTWLALAWLAMASVLNLNAFRWLAAGIVAVAYARLLGVNLTADRSAQNAAEHWIIPVFVIFTLYYFWHVFRRASEALEQSFAPVFTWLAAIPALWLLYLEVERPYIVSAWAAVAVSFLIVGLRLNVSAFRWQSYVAAALAAVSCVAINFAQSGRADMFARIFGASLLIVFLFAAEFLLPRNAATLDAHERHARPFFSLGATLLMTALLYHEVSGGLLTTAWGLEALILLGSGFPARERILRLQGLAVFALCILKLFLYDLRNLETVYRILSFIALGVILLSVSWIYTRFRMRIQRYL